MDTNTKVTAILEALKTDYPESRCALQYKKDYELMVAVRLSAQCTDARVNEVTPSLFAAYPTLEALAEADISHVEELVHSCGFYKKQGQGNCPGLPDVADGLRWKGPWYHGRTVEAAGCGTENRQPSAGGFVQCAGSGGLRHPLHPDLQPPGPGSGRSRRRWSGSSGPFSRRRRPEFCHRLVLHGRAVCTARALPMHGLLPWLRFATMPTVQRRTDGARKQQTACIIEY